LLAALGSPTQAQSAPADDVSALKQRLAQQEQQISELQSRLDAGQAPLAQSPVNGNVFERSAAKAVRLLPTTTIGWIWFVVGFGGEFVFFLRFVVQWWASERAKRTIVPMMFWHLSLAGTGLVLAYAIYRIDPVFILAYSLNIFLYVRNMMIAKRHPAEAMLMEKESQ
jgi:lipid-A-disaccharide synthase-like uncharacterized protein